jgi:DNA-binding NarL/FixJ family response regulator
MLPGKLQVEMKTIKKTPGPAPTRILIVDDHPIMRQGLVTLINNEPDLTVCCEAENAQQAMNGIAADRPDLVILDITLPDKNGLEVIKDLQASDPALPILVVSMHDEGLYAERVLRAGGRGYVMKQEGGKRLVEGIRQVLRGQISVSEKMAGRILELFSGRRPAAGGSPTATLTDREFEVFQLIGQGKKTSDIASHLHLSVKTVEVHRLHIKAKLGLADNTSLIREAVRWVEGHHST